MTPAATERKLELERALDRAVSNLMERYRPRCIILFGSLARGECGEGSDIDLCIIKETETPFIKRMVEARLAADCFEAMDLVVYTPGEWRQMKQQDNYFIRDEIVGAGKVLHGDPE